MSLRNLKVTSIGSNLASVADLRIQTPHSLCCDFRGFKPLQLVGQVAEFKFESKFELLPVIWQSLQRLFQKVIKGLEGKINCQALGAALLLCSCSPPQCAGQTGEDKHRAFSSLLQSLLAATCLLEENMLPRLRYWLSSRVNKVLMLCFGQQQVTFFQSCEMKISMKSVRSCCQPTPRA